MEFWIELLAEKSELKWLVKDDSYDFYKLISQLLAFVDLQNDHCVSDSAAVAS